MDAMLSGTAATVAGAAVTAAIPNAEFRRKLRLVVIFYGLN
jgi:hypothetical protein